MKKLYIGFILLFGFLTFIPQIIEANSPYPPGYREKTYEKAKKAFNSGCIQKYKSKLNKNYKRQYIEFSPNYKNNFIFKYPEFATNNYYYIYVTNNYGSYYSKEQSTVFNCEKEIIDIYAKDRLFEKDTVGAFIHGIANVKEVPPSSFLRFFHDEQKNDIQKIEVIPPSDEEYKKLVANFEKLQSDEKIIKKCFDEYKSNLSEYKGPNLILQEHPSKNPLNFFGQGNIYFVDGIITHSPIPKPSQLFDCHTELLNIEVGMNVDIDDKSGALNEIRIVTKPINVIDVPINSYLKYISETQEVKIILPSDKEYEKAIKQKQGDMRRNIIKINNEKESKPIEFKHFYRSEQRLENNIHNNTKHNVQYFHITSTSMAIAFALSIPLILTLFIEGLIALPFGWKFVGLVSLTNLITNPSMNLILWNFSITSTKVILLFEVFVVLIEWGIYSLFIRKNYVKLLLFSLIANTMSYLIGYMINIY